MFIPQDRWSHSSLLKGRDKENFLANKVTTTKSKQSCLLLPKCIHSNLSLHVDVSDLFLTGLVYSSPKKSRVQSHCGPSLPCVVGLLVGRQAGAASWVWLEGSLPPGAWRGPFQGDGSRQHRLLLWDIEFQLEGNTIWKPECVCYSLLPTQMLRHSWPKARTKSERIRKVYVPPWLCPEAESHL